MTTRIFADEKAQAALEYLYLTAFVIGLAAITALLVQDVLVVQNQAKAKIVNIREAIIDKAAQ
jgi:hypothetical protein